MAFRTSTGTHRRVRGFLNIRRGSGRRSALAKPVVWGAVLCAGMTVFGTVSCQREARPASSGSRELSATLRVVAGNGRLAGGEEYTIAEWRSGVHASGTGYFADFRGQDGGPTLDLSLTGLTGTGEFACGETVSGAGTSVELRVDVNNAYRAAADAPCRIEVQRMQDGILEGRYTATLQHTGNPADEMTVAGTFRATHAGATVTDKPKINAAKGPNLGLR